MSKHINLIKQLIETAHNNQMFINYKRIESGQRLDINLKPYTTELINNMIKFLEKEEEYEKCEVVLNFRNKIMDHENNYVNKKLL